MSQTSRPARTQAEIRDWIVDKLIHQLEIDPTEINLDEPLVAHGVDSMQFVVMVGELEDWLGCRFIDNPLVAYPSVNALSAFIAEQLAQGKTEIDPRIEA